IISFAPSGVFIMRLPVPYPSIESHPSSDVKSSEETFCRGPATHVSLVAVAHSVGTYSPRVAFDCPWTCYISGTPPRCFPNLCALLWNAVSHDRMSAHVF